MLDLLFAKNIPAGKVCVWLAGVAAYILAVATIYPADRVVPLMLAFAAASIGIVVADRKLGLLSWSAGIPAYYGFVFLIVPLVTSALGVEDQSSDRQVSEALYVAAIGLLAYAAGNSIMRFTPKPRPGYSMLGLINFQPANNPSLVATLMLVGAAATLWGFFFGYFGLVPTTERTVGTSSGIVSFFTLLLTVAHIMAWNSYFRYRKLLIICLTSTTLLLVFGIVSNSKERILLPLVLILLSLWGTSGKFPYKLAIVSVLLYALVVSPFVTAFRLVVPAGDLFGSRSDLAETAVNYLLSKEWVTGDVSFFAGQSLGRVSLLPYFSDIVSQSGRSVHFMGWRTFIEGVEIAMPRFLYPDKPDAAIGNWTAQAFGVIGIDDELTNVSPTYMGEFYMSFGTLGVGAGMFLVGAVAVLVDRYLIVHRGAWTLPMMVYFVRWQESFLGHTIIPFARDALVYFLAMVLIKYFFRLVRVAALEARLSSAERGVQRNTA